MFKLETRIKFTEHPKHSVFSVIIGPQPVITSPVLVIHGAERVVVTYLTNSSELSAPWIARTSLSMTERVDW